jgi:16S rRNA G966 N2-methylase RsmD
VSLELKIKARELAFSSKEKDPAKFILANARRFDSEILRLAALQLDFNKSIEKKVPEWFHNGQVLPYQSVNLEQSSSEKTALFKANYLSGKYGADLTGGLGVDSYFISKGFEKFTHNEPSSELSEIVQHNFKSLGVSNVDFTQYIAEEFPLNKPFDWIYLDPSRRDSNANRLYKIEDCLPDLTEIQESLLKHSDAIMVKYSPMLDIKLALSKLNNVSDVIVLAEKNEVKELVFILRKEFNREPKITCVNLESTQDEFAFFYTEETTNQALYSSPKGFLYEPNATILKAGAFNTVATRFGLHKLAPNSHLYTSEELKTYFPGRLFSIKAVTNFDKKSLNSIVKHGKANIACRNFPLKPEEIRKQIKWKDGGDIYLFFTENLEGQKLAIVTEKVVNIK